MIAIADGLPTSLEASGPKGRAALSGRYGLDPDLMALDLACIAYKVCRDEGWPLARVDVVELQYRAFLQIIRDAEPGFSAAPTGAIDTFWHHHILDTEKYFRDCDQLFGRYLHHFPYSGIFDGEDAENQADRRTEMNFRLSTLLANITSTMET